MQKAIPERFLRKSGRRFGILFDACCKKNRFPMTPFLRFSILWLCFLALACNKKTTPPPPEEPPVEDHSLALETLDKNLYIPWGLGYLPNGDLLFTERNGGFNLLKKGATAHITLVTRAVNTNGEGGLLSLAIDPQYPSNHFVYVYETKGNDNRVVRLKYENETLTEDQVILSGI